MVHYIFSSCRENQEQRQEDEDIQEEVCIVIEKECSHTQRLKNFVGMRTFKLQHLGTTMP